jgi:hypothetical protein
MMLNGYLLEKYLNPNQNERAEICKEKLFNQDILESALVSKN